MLTDRLGLFQSLLALAAAAIGLVALSYGVGLARGSLLDLAGLLLLLYAAIVARWRLRVAARPLRLRLLRLRYAMRLRLLELV